MTVDHLFDMVQNSDVLNGGRNTIASEGAWTVVVDNMSQCPSQKLA